MLFSTPFGLQPIALVMFGFTATTVLANPANSFCDRGNTPTPDDCRAAIAKINPNEVYTGIRQFSAGDCTVELRGAFSSTNPPPTRGSDIIMQAEDIVEDGCRGVGFCEDTGGHVSVKEPPDRISQREPDTLICGILVLGLCAPVYRLHVRDMCSLQRPTPP